MVLKIIVSILPVILEAVKDGKVTKEEALGIVSAIVGSIPKQN